MRCMLTSLCTMQALLSITAMQAASCCSAWLILARSCAVTTCTHDGKGKLTTALVVSQLVLLPPGQVP